MGIIESNIKRIHELCEIYRVSKLFVFGSVVSERFSDSSDIDFIVDFNKINIYDYADNYFEFKKALESLFQRKIDLLENQAIKNPYLRNVIDTTKQLVYGY